MNEHILATIQKHISRTGNRLHVFLSGDGLRVARADPFYGEGATLDDALRILSEDIASGAPRAYRDVYGPIEPHYYTGSSSAESPLEADLLTRCAIDAMPVIDCANEMSRAVLVRVCGVRRVEFPKDKIKAAIDGETVEWQDERGLTFRASRGNNLPDGTPCASVACLDASDTAWSYEAAKQAIAPTLVKALSDVSEMPFTAK